MPSAENLPIVAIVGRPNVGKSTLFNRYAGRRRSLVDDHPGITRDRIAETIEVEGHRVLLVDTAGLDPDADAGLEGAVQAQARAAVAGADAVLLVVDGRAGLLPEDEAIARTLRRTSRPVAVAVNKIDTPPHRALLADFHRLGLEPLHATSGEHGTGAFEALEALVDRIPRDEACQAVESAPEEGVVRTALVGRPNVGKSSLLNRLVGEERVVVSDVPGTTRDSVDTRLEVGDDVYVLVDTAGLRRAGRRSRTAERGSALMTLRALERAEVAFVVIDAEEGFTDQDARVAGLVRERGCAAALLANKWDRVRGEDGPRLLRDIEHGLRFMPDTPVLAVSAKTGARVARILPLARRLTANSDRRVPTPMLNRWLQEVVRRHEPAMAQRGVTRRPIKFFYATQTGTRPPTFVLMCTEPRAIRPSYRRFLEKRLREEFGFEGTPVRLRLRKRAGREQGARA